jgi:NAD(P)-dependent dehydrogenase (short-subunit alcohol dehydrogenase family)
LGSQALAVRTDVTQEDEVERLVGTALDRYGRLDAAFNNAGVQERRAPLEQQGRAIYDEVFDGNVRSVFYCLRHQLSAMFARGQGRIVVNASVSGVRNPNPGLSLYSASKAAVISLVRSAALEAAPREPTVFQAGWGPPEPTIAAENSVQWRYRPLCREKTAECHRTNYFRRVRSHFGCGSDHPLVVVSPVGLLS